MTRKKSELTVSKTAAEIEEIFGVYAAAEAEYTELKAELEREANALRQKYEKRINALKHTAEIKFQEMQFWAEQNRAAFKSGRKSLDMLYGRMGFRAGRPAARPMLGYTLEGVLELAKQKMPQYIRTREELNREAILADADRVPAETLAQIGMMIERRETFYAELKSEKLLSV